MKLPLHARPNDPARQHAVARRFGKLLAQGLLAREDCLAALVQAALDSGYGGDIRGLQSRLSWTLDDSTRHWEITRDKAEVAIRARVRVLADLSKPSCLILRDIEGVNEERGAPLLTHEVHELAREEIAGWLRRQRSRRHA